MTTKKSSAKMMTMRQKRERLLFLAKLGEESYLTEKEGKEYDYLRKLFDQPMKNFDPSSWDIYQTLPENWAITKGATMAPRGYVIIDNQKSRFGGERKHGLMPIKN